MNKNNRQIKASKEGTAEAQARIKNAKKLPYPR